MPPDPPAVIFTPPTLSPSAPAAIHAAPTLDPDSPTHVFFTRGSAILDPAGNNNAILLLAEPGVSLELAAPVDNDGGGHALESADNITHVLTVRKCNVVISGITNPAAANQTYQAIFYPFDLGVQCDGYAMARNAFEGSTWSIFTGTLETPGTELFSSDDETLFPGEVSNWTAVGSAVGPPVCAAAAPTAQQIIDEINAGSAAAIMTLYNASGSDGSGAVAAAGPAVAAGVAFPEPPTPSAIHTAPVLNPSAPAEIFTP
jgi:hypothetical protein